MLPYFSCVSADIGACIPIESTLERIVIETEDRVSRFELEGYPRFALEIVRTVRLAEALNRTELVAFDQMLPAPMCTDLTCSYAVATRAAEKAVLFWSVYDPI